MIVRIDERIPLGTQPSALESCYANRADRRHVSIGRLDIDGDKSHCLPPVFGAVLLASEGINRKNVVAEQVTHSQVIADKATTEDPPDQELEQMADQQKCQCQSRGHGHRPGKCPHPAVDDGLCKECNEGLDTGSFLIR